ncbi:MAG: class I SAM-dependent methyltransferase [Leptospirales bacterium]|nr:class I SAM-dependent methyltransferase [Leptospirales bacterium]
MKLYNELAEYYFSIESNHRDIQHDIDLIRSFLHGIDQPAVLDLGCGTGEHLAILKKFGVTGVGIDRSKEMIKIALERNPSGIEFIKSDFRKFDFYNQFDAILCLFGSMVYLLNDNEIDNFFWNTWRALKPGGFGIFELWHSIPVKKIGNKPLSHISRTKYNDTIIERERGFSIVNDINRTIVQVDYLYKVISYESSGTYIDSHVMRAFTLDEISTFIKSNGLEIQNVFANSLKEKFNENSNKMLIVFKKN